MNKLEAKYAAELELRRDRGEIFRYDFEVAKFKLAKATWYTPDFRIIDADGYIEYHEVKGHWESAARVKCKLFVELHPMYRLFIVKRKLVRDGGGWDIEELKA